MHHAYLFEGPLSLLPKLAESACAQFEFKREGPSTLLGVNNPDVHVLEWEKFGIDEARELTREAALKSVSGRALFVLGASSITTESQQALLKLFEEPQTGLIFVLLIPHGTILPTLRSRFLEYPASAQKSFALLKDDRGRAAKDFLGCQYKQRSEWITKFLKDDEGARENTRNFLNDLEKILHPKMDSKEVREALADIAHFRGYLSDRAPSLKMILEHFAMSLPKV